MEVPIYLDYNSTTPCDKAVVDAMLPFFTLHYGNASSKTHPFGWHAAKAVSLAREIHAGVLSCTPEEIVFTSGATESLNLALKGLYFSYRGLKNHIISCSTEHKAVLDTLEYLEKRGAEITLLDADENGQINLEELASKIKPSTLALCLMAVNNETGIIHPLEKLGHICEVYHINFIVDATQAMGKIAIKPQQYNIDFLAYSSHKIYGPKGCGALFINKDKKLKLHPILHGGGHEKDLRSGTLNVPGIVGFGVAMSLVQNSLNTTIQEIAKLQLFLEKELLQLEETYIIGLNAPRVANTTNVWFRFCDSEQIIGQLSNKLAISTGSACASAEASPSHVLMALGLSESQARCCLRISLGRFTTSHEVIKASKLLCETVISLRTSNPKWDLFAKGHDLTGY